MSENIIETKSCSACKEIKYHEEFYICRSGRISTYCKKCLVDINYERNLKKPSKCELCGETKIRKEFGYLKKYCLGCHQEEDELGKVGLKRCHTCKEIKSISFFYKNGNLFVGNCMDCDIDKAHIRRPLEQLIFDCAQKKVN